MIEELSIEEKVDLAISLMILPIEPAVNLADDCLEDISQVEFQSVCYRLIKSTNYWDPFYFDPHFTSVHAAWYARHFTGFSIILIFFLLFFFILYLYFEGLPKTSQI